MSPDLVARVTKSWFSNYDEHIALEIRCAVCDQWTPISKEWSEARPGTGTLELPGTATGAPFVLTRHVSAACKCGAELLLVLTGGAGGRQGEEQYGVAGLLTGGKQFK